jgi:hypothetical protein
MSIFKRIAAVFIGLMLGALVIWAFETMGHNFYPPPADLDPTNKTQLALAIANAPLGALLFIVLAYALGAFFAAMVAQFISNGTRPITAGITGAVLLMLTIANLVLIPHPVWMVIASICVVCLFTWAGGSVVKKKSATKNV